METPEKPVSSTKSKSSKEKSKENIRSTQLISPKAKTSKKRRKLKVKLPKQEQLPEEEGQEKNEPIVYDFDLMLEMKKEEQAKKRKRKLTDEIINDNDDLVEGLINEMRDAAEEDRSLYEEGKPSVKKIGMLANVLLTLKKQDLRPILFDHGLLRVLTEWLAPMHDRTLPSLSIREGILKFLDEFPQMNPYQLRDAGIGKALMYLHRHPKETRANQELAGRLISRWARPIFNLSTDFRALSKEEREMRDFEQMPKRRRIISADPNSNVCNQNVIESPIIQPGDPGWIPRARVPMPSKKDYVVRPKWLSDVDMITKKRAQKQVSRLDKHVRTLAEQNKILRTEHAVTISVNGDSLKL